MKIFIALATIFLFQNTGFCETPFRVKSGKKGDTKIDFAYGSVNGQVLWKQSEYNLEMTNAEVFSGTSPVNSIIYTPSTFEFNLSTCVLNGFQSAEEFRNAQTKDGIIPYIEELIIRLQAYQSANMNSKSKDIQQRLDYLSSEAKNLP